MLADVSHKKTDPNTYTEGDWKAYNTYMMNKWLSMNSHVTEIINFIQKYYSLDKQIHYRMLSDILPKQKLFSKYIKGKKVSKFNPELVNILKMTYEDELNRALTEDGSSTSTFITPKAYYPNV